MKSAQRQVYQEEISVTNQSKFDLKQQLAACLSEAPEVTKVVVFGSFLSSPMPNDMDVAVFLDGEGSYLPLAMKYRRMTRSVAEQIALDIIPVRKNASGTFLDEINRGEVIHER